MNHLIINGPNNAFPVNVDVEQFLTHVLADLHILAGVFEISFVDPPTMISINQAHLGRDYVTDIITLITMMYII